MSYLARAARIGFGALVLLPCSYAIAVLAGATLSEAVNLYLLVGGIFVYVAGVGLLLDVIAETLLERTA